MRRPLPAGTNFSKTSSKFFATCLNVRSIASSLRMSKTDISSSIDFAELSNSSRLSRSWSLCFVKLLYCSNAFLLTCANFFSPSLTVCSFLTNYNEITDEHAECFSSVNLLDHSSLWYTSQTLLRVGHQDPEYYGCNRLCESSASASSLGSALCSSVASISRDYPQLADSVWSPKRT